MAKDKKASRATTLKPPEPEKPRSSSSRFHTDSRQRKMSAKKMHIRDIDEEMHIRDIDEFYDRMDEYLSADDKDKFVMLFKSYKPFVDNFMLDRCVSSGARKCITALLTEEAVDHPIKINSDDLIWNVAFDLADPHILDLLLNRCGGAKYVDAKELPILGSTVTNLSYQAPLCHWSPGDSLIKLLILLFQSKFRNYFDSARLVAKYSNRANDTAWMSVNDDRDLVAFGALLIVAHDKVMLPFPTGLTIKDLIRKEFTAIRGNSREDLKYKLILMGAQELLEIFERVGEPLSALHASMRKYVPVAKVVTDVASVLKKAGFLLTYEDLNVSNYFSPRAGLVNFPMHTLLGGGNLPFGLGDYSSALSSMWTAASSKPVIGQCLHDKGVGILQAGPVPGASVSSVRTFSTFQVAGGLLKFGEGTLAASKPISRSNIRAVATSYSQVSMMSKGMNQACPSLKHFAYVAEKLKKGIKFL